MPRQVEHEDLVYESVASTWRLDGKLRRHSYSYALNGFFPVKGP
jgi:hypothetical protein